MNWRREAGGGILSRCAPVVLGSASRVVSVVCAGVRVCARMCALQPYLFGWVGEKLTRRLRVDAFTTMLRQPMAFFDDSKHDVGQLTSLLSTEVGLVQATTGPKLGVTVQNYFTVGTALIMGFIFSWELSLIVMGMTPLMMFTGLATAAFLRRTCLVSREAAAGMPRTHGRCLGRCVLVCRLSCPLCV